MTLEPPDTNDLAFDEDDEWRTDLQELYETFTVRLVTNERAQPLRCEFRHVRSGLSEQHNQWDPAQFGLFVQKALALDAPATSESYRPSEANQAGPIRVVARLDCGFFTGGRPTATLEIPALPPELGTGHR